MHWHVFPLELVGLHDMRQAQTQQNIRIFFREDFNILNPRVNVMSHESETPIHRYEFPIMQWTVALVYKFTGESFMVSRIVNFLIGCFSMFGIFHLLQILWGRLDVALAGSFAFSLSPAFYFYTMAPMPDNLALCGSTWYLFFLIRYVRTSKLADIAMAAFFISLGTAAKLPYIIFLAPAGYLLFRSIVEKKFINISKEFQIGLIFLLFLLPTLLWYLWVIPTWNNGVITGIFDHSISFEETWEIIKFHFRDMFPKKLLNYTCIPFLFAALFFAVKNKVYKNQNAQILLMAGIAVLAYWVYEFNMIGMTHDYYMMPFLPLLFIILAYGFKELLGLHKITKWASFFLLIFMPFNTSLIAKNYWSIDNCGYNCDVFKYQDDLKNAAPSDAKCIIVNDYTKYTFSYLIDKKAFIFRDDFLPGDWLGNMIKRFGISYLYCSSRKVESDPEVQQHIEKLVLERGEIKVFKLKKY